MHILNKTLTVLILALGIISCNSTAQQSANLSADEFEKAITENKGIQVLDVRTSAEYQSGHLKDALWADWNSQAQFVERTESLDKSKPLYIYCLSGGRSAAAANYLKEKGFNVFNMSGGISAWKRGNKPVEGAVEVKQIPMNEYLAMIPADKTVLVDFNAVWCPPCKKMAPIVEELEKSADGLFSVVKIDGGAQTELTKQLNVEAFPTFIVYKNGKESWRKQGIVSAEDLKAALGK